MNYIVISDLFLKSYCYIQKKLTVVFFLMSIWFDFLTLKSLSYSNSILLCLTFFFLYGVDWTAILKHISTLNRALKKTIVRTTTKYWDLASDLSKQFFTLKAEL